MVYGILVYISLQVVIGFMVSRRIRSQADYFLAGRSLGYGLATFSIFATWFGAETCLGATGRIYSEGLTLASIEPFAYGLCLLLMGMVFAGPLWRLRLTTLADLFRQRYSMRVERLAAILMIPSSVLWAAAQVRAFGHVLASSSQWDIVLATSIAATVVIVYTASGGLWADALTDVVQGVALILGLAWLGWAVFRKPGMLSSVEVAAGHAMRWIPEGWGVIDLLETWAVPLCGSVLAQELVARISASRSATVARNASLLASVGYLSVGLVPVFIGLAATVALPGIGDAEQVMSIIAKRYMSPFFYILFAGAIVSAILSTVDSSLLVASSLANQNLVDSFYPGLGERSKLVFSRVGVVLFGLLAYVLALGSDGVFELVEEASAFGSAGIFVIAVLGLFTGVGGEASALAALVTGATVWIAGHYVLGWSHPYLLALAMSLLSYLMFAGWRQETTCPGASREGPQVSSESLG